MDASQAAIAGGLLRLDIGRTNDFTPFLRFIGHELEIVRSACQRGGAPLGEAPPNTVTTRSLAFAMIQVSRPHWRSGGCCSPSNMRSMLLAMLELKGDAAAFACRT
jgi:hypothetical protein